MVSWGFSIVTSLFFCIILIKYLGNTFQINAYDLRCFKEKRYLGNTFEINAYDLRCFNEKK